MDQKITQLTEKVVLVEADLYPIVDSEATPGTADANKKARKAAILRLIPREESTPFTVAQTDGGKYIKFNSGSNQLITVNATSLEIGDQLIIEQTNTGLFDLDPQGGVTIRNVGGLQSSGIGSGFRLIRISATEFLAESLVGGGGGGGGDMLKSVYDTNDDGSVNQADLADEANDLVGVAGAGANIFYGNIGGVTDFHNLGLIHKEKRTSSQNISGAVVLDLSAAEVFFLTMTGNVTSFAVSNGKVGQDYRLHIIQGAVAYSWAWAGGQFRFPWGNTYLPTDPTVDFGGGPQNSARDIFDITIDETGRANVVQVENLIGN